MRDGKDFDDLRWDDGKPTVTDFVWGRDLQTASLIRAYKDEIERLREVLRFYACKPDCGCKPTERDDPDCGYKARSALEEKE